MLNWFIQRQIEECRELAKHAVDEKDQAFWQQSAARWGRRPDLIWDAEAPGFCIRVHGNGEKSFIFVYRSDNRQRFVRIGTSPRWSLGGARRWAKELRPAVDQGHDPELYNRERQKIKPVTVEGFIQLIAEAKQSEP